MTDAYPVDQLRLVHDEINRQRLSNSARQQAMRDRATILVGAAAIGVAFYASHFKMVLALVAAGVSVVAAILGLLVMRPIEGDDIIVRDLRDNSLAAPDVYSAEYQLVDDKIKALEFDEDTLDRKRKFVVSGFLLLVVSWILAIIVLAIH